MTVAVGGILTLRTLVEPHVAGVLVHPWYDGSCPSLVEELAIVVVADAHYHPVTRLQSLAHGGPQVGVEGACGHAAQRLVLDRHLCCIKILREVVTPAPLSVVAVT